MFEISITILILTLTIIAFLLAIEFSMPIMYGRVIVDKLIILSLIVILILSTSASILILLWR